MKIRFTFKTPDVVGDALREAVADTLPVLPEDEQKAVEDIRVEKLRALSKQWFEYGEYVTVEWDTEADTCTVVKQS